VQEIGATSYEMAAQIAVKQVKFKSLYRNIRVVAVWNLWLT
jgi:hypothetical protein